MAVAEWIVTLRTSPRDDPPGGIRFQSMPGGTDPFRIEDVSENVPRVLDCLVQGTSQPCFLEGAGTGAQRRRGTDSSRANRACERSEERTRRPVPGMCTSRLHRARAHGECVLCRTYLIS